MILNDIERNRKEFDLLEGAIRLDKRAQLLRHIGPRALGLLVWHFGAGGEHRSPKDIPVAKIEEFVVKYA